MQVANGNLTEVKDAGSTRKPRHTIKLALLLMSIVFSAAVFLTLDYFRSAAIRRSRPKLGHFSCGALDPVRVQAFQPNCTSIMPWGSDPYEFSTNSLGLRDERIREVPLTTERPRLLILGNSFTQGMEKWRDSYVGSIASHFPQYEFLNGGVMWYSPSNYLNMARMVLAKGVAMDEVVVFVGVSDVFDEAASYQDVGTAGAVRVLRKFKPPRARFRLVFPALRPHCPALYGHVLHD